VGYSCPASHWRGRSLQQPSLEAIDHGHGLVPHGVETRAATESLATALQVPVSLLMTKPSGHTQVALAPSSDARAGGRAGQSLACVCTLKEKAQESSQFSEQSSTASPKLRGQQWEHQQGLVAKSGKDSRCNGTGGCLVTHPLTVAHFPSAPMVNPSLHTEQLRCWWAMPPHSHPHEELHFALGFGAGEGLTGVLLCTQEKKKREKKRRKKKGGGELSLRNSPHCRAAHQQEG